MATSGDWSHLNERLAQHEQPGRSQPKVKRDCPAFSPQLAAPAAPSVWTPILIPFNIYRGVFEPTHTTHVWGAGLKRDSVEDSTGNKLA